MTTESKEITVAPVDIRCADQYEEKAIILTKEASELKIIDQESYDDAGFKLKNIKSFSKLLEEERRKLTDPMNLAIDRVMALFTPTKTRLENSKRHVEGLMTTYFNQQEEIRKAREKKEQEEAAAIEKREKDRLAKLADKHDAKGNTDKADELRTQAEEVYVAPKPVTPTVQQAKGVSMKKLWKAEVVNIKLVPREYLVINQTMINGIATASKDSLKIPGIRFYSVDSVASR